MKYLIEKQEAEFDKDFPACDCGNGKPHFSDLRVNRDKIKNFISKVRKETSEFVADKMTGEQKIDSEQWKEYYNNKEMTDEALQDNGGYYRRTKEEKEIKQQILKQL